ncbi:ABC transporter ATP-binding protein [Desulfotomaculum sp. 1211_IL3151]|uniref:ABC transporter ATP-binding protein n=1 Tax=Desulfotomaculum sp. 1211_IL3151 TaxID=3084055 RepID=UPI002FDB1FA1
MLLKGENLSFHYQSGNRQILNDFSLAIESGEIVGLRAPSGFGKTTLCKILAGYIMPESGQVTLDGKPLQAYSGYCPVQMIWQHPELVINPRLRMFQVLKEAGDIDDRIIQGLGIQEGWLRRYPMELSGGELQRFCIARALVSKTKFLLADEISTMLDLITQAQIWKFLEEEMAYRNLGVLIVSHSEPLLQKLCSRHLDMSTDACWEQAHKRRKTQKAPV